MKTDPKLDAFESCLHQIRVGFGLDQALKSYPQWAEEFRPMLEAAQSARQLSFTIQVPRAALTRSRARFLAAAQESRPRFNLSSLFPLHFELVSVILLLVLVFGGASALRVAASSLPGDRLYPMKQIAEGARLALIRDPAQRLEMEQRIDRDRLAEVRALVHRGQGADVRFAGGLMVSGSDEWRVGDIRVRTAPSVQIPGELEPGTVVEVEGVLQPDGIVIARRIQARQFEITGVLQSVHANQWTITGVTVVLTSQTRISGIPGFDSRIKAGLISTMDGSLLARSIEVLSLGAAPLFVTPSPSPVLEVTETRVPAATVEPSVLPSNVEEQETPTPGLMETESPDHLNQPLETIRPVEKEKPGGSEKPDGSNENGGGTRQETEDTRHPRSPESDDSSEPPKTPKPEEHEESEHTEEPEHTKEPEHTD